MVPEGLVMLPIPPIDIVVCVGLGVEVVNDFPVVDECIVLDVVDVVDVVIDILIDISMDIPSMMAGSIMPLNMICCWVNR